MKAMTNFLAWLRGTKWMRDNLTESTHDLLSDYCEPDMSDSDLISKSIWKAENPTNLRREAEVEAGNFIYYRVVIGTNIRKSYDGVPIIFESLYSAECALEGDNPGSVISVAAYNRLYGSFIGND